MDKIIKRLAAKYNLDEEVVEKMVRSEFNFVANTMQQGEYQSVMLHHLGKFAVKPNSITRINKLREKYLENAKQVSNEL